MKKDYKLRNTHLYFTNAGVALLIASFCLRMVQTVDILQSYYLASSSTHKPRFTSIDIFFPLLTTVFYNHFLQPHDITHKKQVKSEKMMKEQEQCTRSDFLCGKQVDTGSADAGPMRALAIPS